jgi:hypothetical protein
MSPDAVSPVPLASLRRLARNRSGPRPAPADQVRAERCDMCAEPIGGEHDHVVDLRSRALMCTCHPCHLLFADQEADLHYRAVPRRYRVLDEPPNLDVPVGLYFAFRNSVEQRVIVCYPGPAGATESTLPAEARLPSDVRPDVEAVLVHDDTCYLVPIDVCYELAGRLRRVWRGFDGGREAREEMATFFTRVRERSAP